MFYYICANIVYQESSGTDIAIYQLDENQYTEVRKAMDDSNFIYTDGLSFDINNLKTIPAPFEGRISIIGTFYFP